jgi:hypothetical protein
MFIITLVTAAAINLAVSSTISSCTDSGKSQLTIDGLEVSTAGFLYR